jgi:hypothetical protein
MAVILIILYEGFQLISMLVCDGKPIGARFKLGNKICDASADLIKKTGLSEIVKIVRGIQTVVLIEKDDLLVSELELELKDIVVDVENDKVLLRKFNRSTKQAISVLKYKSLG